MRHKQGWVFDSTGRRFRLALCQLGCRLFCVDAAPFLTSLGVGKPSTPIVLDKRYQQLLQGAKVQTRV